MAGARCTHTLTDKTRDLSKETWDGLRVGMLCQSATDFNNAETAIDQFCTAYDVCDYYTRERLKAAAKRISTLKESLQWESSKRAR